MGAYSKYQIYKQTMLGYTQQDPHDPWSRISLIVGQFGQFFLASNSWGISTFSSEGGFTGGWCNLESGCTPVRSFKCFTGVLIGKFLPAWKINLVPR